MPNTLRKFQYILEGIDQEQLTDILVKRLKSRYPDISTKYEEDVLHDAAMDVASFHAGAEELGTSDIGSMIREVIKNLEKFNQRGQGEKMIPNSVRGWRMNEETEPERVVRQLKTAKKYLGQDPEPKEPEEKETNESYWGGPSPAQLRFNRALKKQQNSPENKADREKFQKEIDRIMGPRPVQPKDEPDNSKPVTEKTSPEIFNRPKNAPIFSTKPKKIGNYIFDASEFEGSMVYGKDAKGLIVRAYDPKNMDVIGSASFVLVRKKGKNGDSWLESDDTKVKEKYRGKGIATAMYQYAKDLGNDIKPSPYKSNAGGAMWKAWGRDVFEEGSKTPSGTTAAGYTWTFEPGREVPMKPDVDANTFIRVKDPTGKTVCGIWADVASDSIQIEYSQIFDEQLRGRGVYTDLLRSLSKQYTVISDTDVNNAAAGIYRRLGADYDHRQATHTLRKQGVAEGATVTRIDSKPITDFATGLQSYKHTDDWSQSGLDTGDDSYWKNKNLKTKTTKGLFAGDPRRTALYATGNAHETRYVEFTQNGQPIVYFDKKDLPAIRSRKTYLTVFDASKFKKLPTGEYFSENPGKPIKQAPIKDPFQYIADHGWVVRITDNLDKVFKQVKSMHKAGKIPHYGAEGMNESQQGVSEGSLNEYRDRMYQYLKSIVPGFPDYVVKDWLYANFARGATQGPGWSFHNIGKELPDILRDTGLSVDTKWQLVPNMKFTMDMWEPKTLKRLRARAGGNSKTTDPGVHIPHKDAERHATQAALAQQQGGIRKEPVILIKTSQGYELLEGWHRTIQHFAMYPQGYTGPAYVAVAQGQQGIAEGLEQDYLSQIPNLTWKPVSRGVWNTIQDEGLDEEQDAPKHTDWVMASLSIDPKDARALQAFDNDAIEDFNRFDIHLKSRYPGLTDLIDYDRGTVTIVKPIQMQGVAEDEHDTQSRPRVVDSMKSMVDVGGIKLNVAIDGAEVSIRPVVDGHQAGYVVFDRDGRTLVPDDLAIDDEFRGRGIAKIIYDYVKSLGFTIRRSSDQTRAGKHFWDKNRGEDSQVWEQTMTAKELDEACWKGYHKEGNKKMFGKTYPNCVKNTNEEQDMEEDKKPSFMKSGNMKPFTVTGKEKPGAVNTLEKLLMKAKERGITLNYHNIDQMMQAVCKKHNLTGDDLHNHFVDKHHMIPDKWIKKQDVSETMFTTESACPHCGGELVSEEMINEKKDACYYKVKSRYKVWPSAYASGALVKCRKKGASNWGNSSKNESSILEGLEQTDENLHKWFKEKWVRFGPDGKIRGACARGDDSEGKPKCLPQSKAQNLGKKGRASAAARKRREDPNPERSGKAINVATKKKTSESSILQGISETKGLPMPGSYEQENKPFLRKGGQKLMALTTEQEELDEKWSDKYKKSIDCSHPKGFSQRAHCQGRKKK